MVDMLIMRGARINVMNRGDDTPLHLAASHGHRDIVQKVPASRGQQHPAPSPPPSGHPPGPCAAPWQTAEQDPAQPSVLSTQDSLPLSPHSLPCRQHTASPPWCLCAPPPSLQKPCVQPRPPPNGRPCQHQGKVLGVGDLL